MSNWYYYNGTFVPENELKHYGIPGMKWGHRKARPLAPTGSLRRKALDGLADMGGWAGLSGVAARRAGYGTKNHGAKKAAAPATRPAPKPKPKPQAPKQMDPAKAARVEAARKKAVKKVIARAAGQTVAGIAMTAAGRAMQKRGQSAVGEILSVGGLSLLGGTAVGAVAGGSLAIANKRRIKKQQAQYR